MKNTKSIKIRALAMLMLLCMMLSACTQTPPATTTESKTARYVVTVIGTDGEPCTTGVIVKFMKDGAQVGLQAVDATGVAAKVLDKGDYTVELQFTDSSTSYHYDATEWTLSATKTELEIVLSHNVGEERSLFVGGEEFTAYYVNSGNTYVELNGEKRNYFIFRPTEGGLYEFSVDGQIEAIGYYGAPYFVQDMNSGEMTGENVFTVNVRRDSIGTAETGTVELVIGIDAAEGKDHCNLKIKRLSDPILDIADLPWDYYQTTATLTKYTLPSDAAIREFDLTKSASEYTLVLGEDGYYHLNAADGPLVLARIGMDAELNYATPLASILSNGNVAKYFFDENGDFVKKELYNNCLMDYLGEYDFVKEKYVGGYIDEASGTYPLTRDLMYIIQQYGDYVGWWDTNSPRYIFVDQSGLPIPGINPDTAWLFMCCYLG